MRARGRASYVGDGPNMACRKEPKMTDQPQNGFGAPGATPGAFYGFDVVRQNTPNPDFVNTLEPR